MKGKILLGVLLLSGGMIVGQCRPVRQRVLAETTESSSTQQEFSEETFNSLNSFDSTEITSTIDASSSSSVIESREAQAEISVSSSGGEELSELISSDELVHSSSSEVNTSIVEQFPIPKEKVEENFQFSVVKNHTTEEFIQTIGIDAQEIAWNEGLYASVMIAQAILETGSGNSRLARPPYHNLFGIKGDYQGKNVSFNTQEDKGNGEWYTIQSAFRQYPGYKESLKDYAKLLKKGLSSNPNFYQGTWKEYAETYQEATKALTGKYATDTAYDKKLNALIESYQLTSFDQRPEESKPADIYEKQKEEPSANESLAGNNPTNESKKSEVTTYRTSRKVQQIKPIPQRPAKQVAGNRVAQ